MAFYSTGNLPMSSTSEARAALNGYDYRNQAFVVNGRYAACSHPASMACDCFGTRHLGELLKANADVH
jgi:hypothetical protein